MKRILTAAMASLAAAALTGCTPAGPKTTAIDAVERPLDELMPAPTAAEAAAGTATATVQPAPAPPERPTIEPPPPSPEKAPKLHAVQTGDTLMSIARKYYQDASRYKDIAEANSISDPDEIYIGQVLKIPD